MTQKRGSLCGTLHYDRKRSQDYTLLTLSLNPALMKQVFVKTKSKIKKKIIGIFLLSSPFKLNIYITSIDHEVIMIRSLYEKYRKNSIKIKIATKAFQF